MSSTKSCLRCGESKDLSDFFKDKTTKDGLHRHCKPCYSARKAKWRRAKRYRSWLVSVRDELGHVTTREVRNVRRVTTDSDTVYLHGANRLLFSFKPAQLVELRPI